AFQPPFAIASTNVSSSANILTLQNGFPAATAAVTNSFAADPNYRLGYVQVWNLDIQRQLPAGIVMNVGYSGSKGTRLDVGLATGRPLHHRRRSVLPSPPPWQHFRHFSRRQPIPPR